MRDVASSTALHRLTALDGPICVILPLDQLFDIRAASALRLWRTLVAKRTPAKRPSLSKARRDRLILALRALDGRASNATYREIANALFRTSGVTERSWKTHDVRDRTIRLVRYGTKLMLGGYRQLLLFPFRRL